MSGQRAVLSLAVATTVLAVVLAAAVAHGIRRQDLHPLTLALALYLGLLSVTAWMIWGGA